MPGENDPLFDDFNDSGSNSKNGKKFSIAWLFVAIISVVLVALWSNRQLLGFHLSSTSKNDPSVTDTEKIEYIDFAERFAVAAFNMSYNNMTDQIQKVGDMMSDDLLEAYKNDFLSTEFRQKMIERRIYVVFQKVERASVSSIEGDTVIVRVNGLNFFNSDVSGSQIQVPFSLDVFVRKRDGKLSIVNFHQRI